MDGQNISCAVIARKAVVHRLQRRRSHQQCHVMKLAHRVGLPSKISIRVLGRFSANGKGSVHIWVRGVEHFNAEVKDLHGHHFGKRGCRQEGHQQPTKRLRMQQQLAHTRQVLTVRPITLTAHFDSTPCATQCHTSDMCKQANSQCGRAAVRARTRILQQVNTSRSDPSATRSWVRCTVTSQRYPSFAEG